MTIRELVEIMAAATMPGVVVMLIINRGIQTLRMKKGGGIGARSIQFVGVSMLFPTIVILALEKLISGETIAALLGAAVGYLLSGLSHYDLARLIERLPKPHSPEDLQEED